MLMKQKGIIIKTVDYGESDKIITILNENGAKVPLMAKRAKKSKTGLQANTQLFVYGLFIYAKLRGLGVLNSVDVINQNYQLRLDIYESSYAALCAEIIDKSMEDEEISQFNFQLLAFCLERINKKDSAQLMSIIVLLKKMNDFGFTIDFGKCAVSADNDQSKLNAFSFKFHGVISRDYINRDPKAIPISNKTLYLLDVLQKLSITKMNQLNIHQEILDEMSDLLIMLYREYAGIFFRSQKLINQLKRLETNQTKN
ncbi:DNA repair protein RecO [Staphylococcus debuckii]|uniref:DNA repair protein RecO n=1 Tax=Staphylococcus debuckii TaxID=2044912 RepID=A0ABU9F156_9STAP|nr:DNA repair protein RecO [Staphylococcus debuckii]AYU55355.1 DNA repair protein RecO [Staphylococcus debuckii]